MPTPFSQPGPLERTRQHDIDQMPAARTKAVIRPWRALGDWAMAAIAPPRNKAAESRHLDLRLISIPPNETTLRMILSRLFVDDRSGRYGRAKSTTGRRPVAFRKI